MRSSKPDLPYPSFTLVLSSAANDSSRLPSRCEVHRRRHHPYARHPPCHFDHLMDTVDYRNVGGQFPSILAQRSIAPTNTNDELASLRQMFQATPKAPIKHHRSLATLIVDLAVAVRQKCRRIQPVRQLPSLAKIDLLE